MIRSKTAATRSPRAFGDRPSAAALRCRRKFLRIFPDGFRDVTYVAWERGYKWRAHQEWTEVLDLKRYRSMLEAREFAAVAAEAVRIESRTNLLFSFEKMALRDAVKWPHGARSFATALFSLLHGPGTAAARFDLWLTALAALPVRQTRVLSWPVATIFPFIAQPRQQIYLKPVVTHAAAAVYGFDLQYRSKPNWETYRSLLEFCAVVKRDLRDLHPRDMIDIQSFIWVLGSDEYA